MEHHRMSYEASQGELWKLDPLQGESWNLTGEVIEFHKGSHETSQGESQGKSWDISAGVMMKPQGKSSNFTEYMEK
jgi:hypothetical protein